MAFRVIHAKRRRNGRRITIDANHVQPDVRLPLLIPAESGLVVVIPVVVGVNFWAVGLNLGLLWEVWGGNCLVCV